MYCVINERTTIIGDPFGDLGDFDSSIVTSLTSGGRRGGGDDDDGTRELAALRMTKKQRKHERPSTAASYGDNDDGDDDGFGDDAAAAEFYAAAAGAQRARKKAHADAHAMLVFISCHISDTHTILYHYSTIILSPINVMCWPCVICVIVAKIL
jgi:hypothetical protein